jgi:uncharacterized membrane protein YjfL (UPF0719 family)
VLELVAQVLAYTGVGLVVLFVGFVVVDLLTPGHLGRLVAAGNPNAALLSASALVSLGLILWFAIYFTGAGWSGLDDAAVFGVVGVVTQAVGFLVLDVLIPGKLLAAFEEQRMQPGTWVAAALHVAVALVVSASLT